MCYGSLLVIMKRYELSLITKMLYESLFSHYRIPGVIFTYWDELQINLVVMGCYGLFLVTRMRQESLWDTDSPLKSLVNDVVLIDCFHVTSFDAKNRHSHAGRLVVPRTQK